MDERYPKFKETLNRYDQSHVFSFYGELDEAGKAQLLDQIEAQDWGELSNLADASATEGSLPDNLEPAPYYPQPPTGDLAEKYARAKTKGEELIRAGKVAAFTVAGGQGTRLGWDGPKGSFPATPIKGKPLFQVFAENLRKVQQKYDTTVPWYLMTSEINDAETRSFFEEHAYFGLEPGNVMFFKQGSMPSLSEGKVLLSAKDSLALNPDGHGGSLKALYKSGALEDMQRRGVEQISYFQVDNPNVKPVDPLFIGLHVLDGAEMSAKALPKAGPKEKVGNFCRADGRTTVIEYSDMPDELANQRDDNGDLRFNAGSIAIHLLSVAFVKRLNEAGGHFALPYHRAHKKVPYIDTDTGEHVEPESPNATKLETFVFDALPLAKETVLLETDRVEEFAPIKNAQGDDSPETSRHLQTERAARWLEGRGVEVARKEDGQPDAIIELSPLTAVSADDLKGVDLPSRIEPGSELEL